MKTDRNRYPFHAPTLASIADEHCRIRHGKPNPRFIPTFYIMGAKPRYWVALAFALVVLVLA